MSEPPIYDPLAGRDLISELSAGKHFSKLFSLNKHDKIPFGSGVYLLYYTGKFELYSAIASQNKKSEGSQPIYIGKAVPRGARTASRAASISRELRGRVRKHYRSIEAVESLSGADFQYKYIRVTPEAITIVEQRLIRHYRPIWNTTIDGFGVNDPGRGRYNQLRSVWDTLHPGREYAARCAARDYNKTLEKVRNELIKLDLLEDD